MSSRFGFVHATAEFLEARQLLSASPAVKGKAVAFPNMVGFFAAAEKVAAGSTAITLDVLAQKNGNFSGIATQADGSTSRLTGTVTKKGAVQINLKGTSSKFSTKVVGKVAGDVLTAKFNTTAGKHHSAGAFSGMHIHAGFVSVGGAAVIVTPPQNQSTGAWENDTQIPVFIERQNYLLPQAVNVDISAFGTSPSLTDAHLSAGPVAAGTLVNVYSLHFDVVGAPSVDNAVEAKGSVTLAENIIGIIVLSDSLTATNALLGIPGDTYPFGSQYGLELNPVGGGSSDVVTLSGDRHTLTFDLRTANSADNIRIITAAPAST